MATAESAAKYSSFLNLSSFLAATRAAADGPVDRRLTRIVASAPSSGSIAEEAVGADGGYIVPPEFIGSLSSVIAEQTLAGLCLQKTTTSFSVNAWTDPTPSWSSSGPKAKRVVEGAAGAQSKPVLEGRSVPLHKLQVLIPASEELFEDTTGGAELFFQQMFRNRVAWEVNRWLLAGSGVGESLGLLSSPATLTQTKESGPQTADTIVLANLAKMLSKLHPPARSRSAWVFSPSAWAYVEQNLAGPQAVISARWR